MQVLCAPQDFVTEHFPPPQQHHSKPHPGGTTDRAATLQDGGGETGRGSFDLHASVCLDFFDGISIGSLDF